MEWALAKMRLVRIGRWANFSSYHCMSVDRRCAYQRASDNAADGLVVVLYCNYMGKSVLRFYVVNSDLSVVCV